jgi:hypothetical protein
MVIKFKEMKNEADLKRGMVDLGKQRNKGRLSPWPR